MKWPLIPDERDTDGETYINNCKPYQCRTRPWYVGAVSVPKDVVIMIDQSCSMSEKWKIVINSTIELINSLSFPDNVNVMLFSKNGIKNLIDENLISFNSKLKDELIKQLESERHEYHDKDFKLGFEKAFDLFSSTKNNANYGIINRIKMIMVITDGNTDEKKSEILNYITNRQEEVYEIFKQKVIIHSLLINMDRLDTSLVRQISCQNAGISLIVKEENVLSELLIDFLSFNALMSIRTTSIWVEPFENFSGLGSITTVVKPVFSE